MIDVSTSTPIPKKLFIVRKYVMASSAEMATQLEKNYPADDVFIDDEWRKNQMDSLSKAIGFDNK